MTGARVVGPVDAVTVQGARSAEFLRQKAVPQVPAARWQREPRAFTAVDVEKAELDALRDGGEHDEIRAAAGPVRT